MFWKITDVIAKKRTKIVFSGPISPEQRARDAKLKILKKRAADYLPRRLDYLARKYGFEYKLGKLGLRKTRWGSCTSNGVISLNIGLMQFIPSDADISSSVKQVSPVVDYVIIHELCHLRHLNHSKEFWAEVAKYDPKYKAHRKFLKERRPEV